MCCCCVCVCVCGGGGGGVKVRCGGTFKKYVWMGLGLKMK